MSIHSLSRGVGGDGVSPEFLKSKGEGERIRFDVPEGGLKEERHQKEKLRGGSGRWGEKTEKVSRLNH